jgi:hypothetical protein
MKKLNRSSHLALAVIASVLMAGSADAACFVQPAFGNTNPCNNCSYESGIVTTRDQACERGYSAAGGNVTAEFLSNKVVEHAKHGVAGTSGNGMAYMPAKGYAGPDDFKVAVDFKDRTGVGKFYIHFNVTVK